MGAVIGRWIPRNLSPRHQLQARQLLAGLTLFTGLAVVWTGLPAQPIAAVKVGVGALVALSLGSLTGHLLGLQRLFSGWVSWAAPARVQPGVSTAPSAGFPLEAVVMAANPLGWIGAVLEGWTGDWRPLALKGALDALAAMGFAVAGSRTVWLAALPVIAVQGTLSLAAAMIAQRISDPASAAGLHVCSGLLVITLTPVVLGLRKVPLANYLPALIYAPVISHGWH